VHHELLDSNSPLSSGPSRVDVSLQQHRVRGLSSLQAPTCRNGSLIGLVLPSDGTMGLGRFRAVGIHREFAGSCDRVSVRKS